MLRLVAFLLAVFAVASGLVWLADRPGAIQVEWQGYLIETTVFQAAVVLAASIAAIVFAISIIRQVWNSPAAVGRHFLRRRQKRGLESLSSGMIAIGAGDRALATRYALQARKTLPNEPLTHLLRAQAAQLSGDKTTARRIFEAMLGSPDTEQLGLRGLFLEAEREHEIEAAHQFAERAMRLNPKLGWSVEALFDLQCRRKDWVGALETLSVAKRNGVMDRPVLERRRAVLLAGQAQALEDQDSEKALGLALESHGLAPDLIPAAAVAGRLFATKGNTARAAKILQKTWSRAPHPDLATAYAYARIGDSPLDRLQRVRQLAALNPHSIESPIAVAIAAIEARNYAEARTALEPLLKTRLTQRVATLMARIEDGEFADKGRVREWLARAINAERDCAWTADGVVSSEWAPVSPVTGKIDAYEWRVPVEMRDQASQETLAQKIEDLVALGAPGKAIDAMPITVPVTVPVAVPETMPATATANQTKTVSSAPDWIDVDASTGTPPQKTQSPIPVAAPKTAPSNGATPSGTPVEASLKSPNASIMKKPAPSSIHPARPEAEVLITTAATRQSNNTTPRLPDDPGPGEDDDTTPIKRAHRTAT